jgi:hypothetical protein
LAKHVLHTRSGDLDFLLFGIATREDQYRAVTLVNGALQTSLRLAEYMPVEWKSDKVFSFSLFHDHDEKLAIEYFFIPNLSNFSTEVTPLPDEGLFSGMQVDEQVRLIRELPKTDYFLLARGDQAHAQRHRIIDTLRTIPEFDLVQSIEPAGLASKANLIF